MGLNIHNISMRAAKLLMVLILSLPVLGVADNAPSFPKTTRVLTELVATGQATWYQYKAYEQQAHGDNLKEMATLFAAMAASQSVITQRLESILNNLGGKHSPCPVAAPTVRGTRDNLRAAIEMELLEIDVTFPRALKEITNEGYSTAIRFIQVAIDAQTYQRKTLKKIYGYTKNYFGALTARFRKHNPTYFISRQTGAVILDELPPDCPIMGGNTTAYVRLMAFKTSNVMTACLTNHGLAQLDTQPEQNGGWK